MDTDVRYKTYKDVNILDELYIQEKQKVDNVLLAVGDNTGGLIDRHEKTYTLPSICLYSTHEARLSIFGIPVTRNNQLLINEKQYLGGAYQRLNTSEVPAHLVHKLSKAVSLIRPADHIYGHWLIDILPQVYLLEKCLTRLENITYIINKSCPEFIFELLGYLGIDKKRILQIDPRQEGVIIDQCFFVDNLRYDQVIHTAFKDFSAFMRQKALDNSMVRDRLFISRRQWVERQKKVHRTLINFDEVQEFYLQKGFTIVHPETLTFSEQIKLFSNASYIVGEDGSGLHNSIFAHSAMINCIRGSMNHSLIQASLDAKSNNNIGYLLGRIEGSRLGRESNFVADLNALEKLYEASSSFLHHS